MTDYVFGTKPFAHQLAVFMASRDKEYYALLMEMGTGKTKVTIDTACWLYNNGLIDAMLVVAPNGVQRNWVTNEIPIHAPEYIQYSAAWYNSNPNRKEEKALSTVLQFDGLKIVSMNIESFATVKGNAFAKNFLTHFKCMLVIDESSTIKNPSAQRTKNLLKLSTHALYRRILTGTPVTQGPLDVYTQFAFLDPHILRTSSYYAFRNRYAILKEMRTAGRSFMNVVGYTNLDELTKLIEPHSYRVTKAECLDLPEKLYTKAYVKLSTQQRKLYDSLKKDVLTEFNGKLMSAPLALTKLLRLQQIVGGFFVPDIVQTEQSWMTPQEYEEVGNGLLCKTAPEPIDSTNPRIELLMQLLEEANGKVIIWARFRSEIQAISSNITKTFGAGMAVEYHGGIDNSSRSCAIDSFQNDPKTRFFIGHVQAGGKGLTLHAATSVVYYSNDFSLENRLQSEDRCHRIGQKNNVMYIDIIAEDTLDEHVVKTLRDKKNVADLVTGDVNIEHWI